MSVQLSDRPDSDVAVLENDGVANEIITAVDAEVPEHRCGPGACMDCACQGFVGSSYICENCQHPYNHHYA